MKNPENKLADETSPYLLQHADNPVNWQSWNKQALALAKEQNKPILLSIGYSACHWCHVMAHESFENNDIAELMNKYFINIKVDREERPDLDKIYQTSHSLLTGRPGGWPLTVFLTPADQMPFYAGTYFPNEAKYGMPAFSEILTTVDNLYKTRLEDIREQNDSLQKMLSEANESTDSSEKTINTLPLDLARKQIETVFDSVNGGFSSAPKFPHPNIIERTLRHWSLLKNQGHDDPQSLHMANHTLNQMALGGIFDHIGGGFYRYSTDDKWMIPHFEKMLYDNAQLLINYAHAYQITQQPLYKSIIEKTAQWVINEMQSPEGGFYSAMDADTEGEEGKFYVWEPDEIKNLLSSHAFEIFSTCYGLNREANFEGKWHLHTYTNNKTLADNFNTTETDIENILNQCTAILFKERQKRTQPGIDDKILTSWNALMIKGLASAGRILNRPDFIISARSAALFIKKRLWHNNRLMATYKDNKSHLNAYLDDYAYLLNALIELLQCQWDNEILNWAELIANSILENFEDTDKGGFFFTSHDHEHLIQRIKTYTDESTPSGNGICSQALYKLGLLIGESRYLSAAENCIKSSINTINQNTLMHSSMINAIEEQTSQITIIILRGTNETLNQANHFLSEIHTKNFLTFSINNDIDIADKLSEKKPINDFCAYICKGMTCNAPLTSIKQLKTFIQKYNETH
ncbi:MAG: thioredoxin domain-containing protein [Gammaproteobacteria bacterium]|nr:thioredoxin domain-containing protein [Gammaproteobacteria bacterium]MCW9003882.1 thioredoxin domain-containing protein [Gammaproteobacteria bacterium]MCW9055171.1 thioredoxin domain-containing protein [Gammaproteobacteria bacterium]